MKLEALGPCINGAINLYVPIHLLLPLFFSLIRCVSRPAAHLKPPAMSKPPKLQKTEDTFFFFPKKSASVSQTR